MSEQNKTVEEIAERCEGKIHKLNLVGDSHNMRLAIAAVITEATAPLKVEVARLREALEWFCERVDKGEVRSRRTYKQFKELLARTALKGNE